MKLTFIIQGVLILLARSVFGRECGQYDIASTCNSFSECSWIGGQCQCNVYREMDFVFAVDKSGSMGAHWDIVLDWLKYTIPQLNVNSRVAWIPFDSQIYPDTHNDILFNFPPLSHWNSWRNCCDKNQQTTNLLNYIDNRLPFPDGGTNIFKPVRQAIDWYTDPSIEGPVSRQKILIIITDGVGADPCLLKQEVIDANIRVIIIGISDQYDRRVECLLSSQNDLYLIPTHQDINNIDPRFYETICEGTEFTPAPAPTLSPYQKCQGPCKEGTSGPCIKQAPGDFQCDAYYIGTSTCPWDSIDCNSVGNSNSPTTSPTTGGTAPSRAPTMMDKCEHGCDGPNGPCMHTNLGDFTCHQFNAFGECPQGTAEGGSYYDCSGMNEKCGKQCYGDSSGPCRSPTLGDFNCWEKDGGSCPPGTIDCSARTSAALNNYKIADISRNVKDFEYNINYDMRIMMVVGGVSIAGCLICFIGILAYVYNKTKNKTLGFSKVGTSDFDTVATVVAVN